jgi:microcystin degradation protein MlrC
MRRKSCTFIAFAPIARTIHYIAGPGALGADYASLPYAKPTRSFWPRVADPFGQPDQFTQQG